MGIGFLTFECLFQGYLSYMQFMNILIVVATQAEIQPFMSKWAYVAEKQLFRSTANEQGQGPDILITGPGMVNTIFHLTKILSHQNYDLILNVGIAGSFNPSIPIGSVVNVYTDIFSEWGAEDGSQFLNIFEMGLIDKNQFPYQNGELMANFRISENIKNVKGITVNKVHGEQKSINAIMKLFHPDIESMEGAAVFFVAAMQGLHFAQIRAISNVVEKRNREKWDIPLAIDSLCLFLFNWFQNNDIKKNADVH